MAEQKLKPCPFCGTRPKVREAINWPAGFWIVGCVSVRCDFNPEFQHQDKRYAVGRWNRRASK